MLLVTPCRFLTLSTRDLVTSHHALKMLPQIVIPATRPIHGPLHCCPSEPGATFVFGSFNKSTKLETYPVSRTASGEISQNNGDLVRRQGIAIVVEVSAMCEQSRATFCSPRFWLICSAKASCGKEAFLLKAFWLLLWRQNCHSNHSHR